MSLTKKEKLNLTLFLRNARIAISRMADNTKYPELKELYDKIAENLSHVPINIKSGSSLDESFMGTTFGENVKRLYGGTLQSAIRIPRNHLFDDYGNIRSDGALTLLHEESHIVLPRSAQAFTAKVGLAPEHADEFFADVLSAHLAKNIGIPRDVIGRHLSARRTYFRFPIDRFALEGRRGVAEEIRAGRFTPRTTRRPEPRDPFRAPEERSGWGIFPRPKGPREGASIFPGLGREMPRRFNPRI